MRRALPVLVQYEKSNRVCRYVGPVYDQLIITSWGDGAGLGNGVIGRRGHAIKRRDQTAAGHIIFLGDLVPVLQGIDATFAEHAA